MNNNDITKVKFEFLRTAMAIGISLIIMFIIIMFVSSEPLKAITYLFLGPLETFKTFSNVLVLMIPLMLTGTATCIIFSSNSLNLAVESAFYMGGIVTTIVALAFKAPTFIHLPIIFLASMAVGSVVTGIPGYLKIKTNSDEMVVSLMLNYILFSVGLYILNYHLKDYNATGLVSWKLPANLALRPIFKGVLLHSGLYVAIIVVIASYLAMYKTKWGLRVRVTGSNASFAKFVGIHTSRTSLSTQLIGGAIGGLAGSVELLGLYKRFTWLYPLNFGWDGIILATLARNNPIFIPLTAFFIAYLRIGSDIMARKSDVPKEVLGIVQGIIIILIISEKLIAKFQKKALYKQAKLDLSAQAVKEGK